ncbi:MAG: TauD/TfdA family dioxygenase [Rhodospirillales bacterium]
MVVDSVRIRHLLADKPLPLVAEPTDQNIDLVKWTKRNIDLIESALLTEGSVLFRGFGSGSMEFFRQFADVPISEYMAYEFALTLRPRVSDYIYKSSMSPPDFFMALHNDCCAQRDWPTKVIFFCAVPAERGGETPLADCRKVYNRLTPEVRDKFARLGVMYIRDIPEAELADVFGSSSTSYIDAYCKRNDFDFEWDHKGGIHVCFVAQAVIEHPKTAEMLWFNHAHSYLRSGYPFLREPRPIPRPVAAIPYERENDGLYAHYGDGSPIDAGAIYEIHNAYMAEAIAFPWQKGDILLLDNMLVAHGRNRFAGEREILLAMGDSYRSLVARRGKTVATP